MPNDEVCWFMRSHWTPADFRDADGFDYAVDVPGVNRWVYWTVLKATGLDKVGPNEKPCWVLYKGRIYFRRPGGRVHWYQNCTPAVLEGWVHAHGRFAPRKALMAMRMANLCAFTLMLVALWWVACVVLGNTWLAVLATLPVILAPAICVNTAFISWSGDAFLIPMFAITLAAWMWLHLRNRDAGWSGVFVIGGLCGVAVSAKLTGVLLVAAYSFYLAAVSRGASRAVKPAAACAIAFMVFSLINPVMLFGGSPQHVIGAILARRAHVVGEWIGYNGPLGWTKFVDRAFFWWPLSPVVAMGFWRCRRCHWFAPLASWFVVNTLGMLVGIAMVNRADSLYIAPIYVSAYFPIALVLLYAVRPGSTQEA